MAMTIFPHRRMYDESTLVRDDEAEANGQTVYAFLREKERRSRSMRTVQAYSRILFQFFDALGMISEELSSIDLFSYTHSIRFSGMKPSSLTLSPRNRLSQFSFR